jgi:hypothetical protein
MGTDETTSDETTTDETTSDETTTEVGQDEEAEVTGLAMGIRSPLGSLDRGLPGADLQALARKAGEMPHDDGVVNLDEVINPSIQ